MKRLLIHVPLLLFCFVCAEGRQSLLPEFATVAFAEDLSADESSIEVVGLSILKPMTEKETQAFNQSSYGYEESGTTIYVRVDMPRKTILAIRDIRNKPVVLSDDTGKRLSAPDRDIKDMSFFSRISKNQESFVVPLHGTKAPDKLAKSLFAKGPIRVVCGSDIVTGRVKVELPSKENITIGPHEFAISQSLFPGGKNEKDVVNFVSPKPLEWIKELKFFDEDGKPIASEPQGSGELSNDKSTTYHRTYKLKESHKAVNIECTYYKEFNVYDILLDLEFAVGMSAAQEDVKEK